MLSFGTSRGRIVIDPKSLFIKEFRDLWASVELSKATDILTYVHISAQIDPDAPFFSSRSDEVQQLAAKNTWGEKYEETININEYDYLIDAYLDSFEKAESRMLRSFDNKIDQFTDLLADTTPEISKSTNAKLGTFTYVTNVKSVISVMKEIRSLIKEKREIESIIKEESHKESKVWGQKRSSYLEKKKMQDATRQDRRRALKKDDEYIEDPQQDEETPTVETQEL